MVQNIDGIRHSLISGCAKRGRIIVARTHLPRGARVVLNVYLSGGVLVAQELRGNDWDRVFLVVDVGHCYRHGVVTIQRIDVVGEGGIAHARQGVADHGYVRARWEVQLEVDGLKERESRAERVSRDDHGGSAVLVE
jgi:hypothetical protein